MKSPFTPFLEHQSAVILDGGLATALEARGFGLNDELWSARVLLDDPLAIREVHTDFLAAGADCITTASYQASIEGFRKQGYDERQGVDLILLSVALALDARNRFWDEVANREGRLRPLVAASVGPYGAYLADGSEYTGDYDSADELHLYDFHKVRWDTLAGSTVDLLACETVPSRTEAMVLLRLLEETPGAQAWMSFCCRDGAHLSDGTPIVDMAEACNRVTNLAAVGVNCTAPENISSLIENVRRATDKPVIVYPNHGKRYDALTRTWDEGIATVNAVDTCGEWATRGAVCIGGCCGVSPDEIAGIRAELLG